MEKLFALVACMVGIVALSAITCWIVWSRGAKREPFRQFYRAATRFRLNAVASSIRQKSDPWLDGRDDVVFCQNLILAYQIGGIAAFIVLSGLI